MYLKRAVPDSSGTISLSDSFRALGFKEWPKAQGTGKAPVFVSPQKTWPPKTINEKTPGALKGHVQKKPLRFTRNSSQTAGIWGRLCRWHSWVFATSGRVPQKKDGCGFQAKKPRSQEAKKPRSRKATDKKERCFFL